MKTKLIILGVALVFLSSCKKDYTCECFNPSGVFQTHTITGTYQEAQAQCQEYSAQYQTVPMSETACELK